MVDRILYRSKVVLFGAVICSLAAIGLAAATPDSASRALDEASRLCKFDGKINSIGAVIKDAGHLYRCTRVLEERDVAKAAWVQVQVTTSIVTE